MNAHETEWSLGRRLYETEMEVRCRTSRWDRMSAVNRNQWELVALRFRVQVTGDPEMELVAVLRPRKP